MRLLGKDVDAGEMRLQVDTLDDLWALTQLIQEGDLATAATTRTVEGAGDKLRPEKAEKRPMTLGVRVQSVEWHGFDDHLRVHGVIEQGPQDLGRHHTLVLRDAPGTRVKVRKRGRLEPWHLQLVKEAQAASKAPRVAMVAIDDEEAQLAVLRGHGIQFLGSVRASGMGKRGDADPGEAKLRFFEEAARAVAHVLSDPEVPLLVVGPGWWREEFMEHLRQAVPKLVEGALTDGTSQGGRAGIHEALRRGQLSRLARDHRVQVESERVEELFSRLARAEGLAAVGPEEVRAALQAGAAEEVLVSDERVRDGSAAELLRLADATRCQIRVVSTAHEEGVRLARLAGVAALLRFRPG